MNERGRSQCCEFTVTQRSWADLNNDLNVSTD